MTSPLEEMFKHNLWANLVMLDTCATLTDEQLDATFPGTYGSIRATLLHIFGAEERYAARINGQPRPPSREHNPYTGIDDLRAAANASGQAMIDIAGRHLLPDMLKGLLGSGQTSEVATNILIVQAINHATEHRAHINTILTQLNLEPFEVDGWNYGAAYNLSKVY